MPTLAPGAPRQIDLGNPVADHPYNRGLSLWALPLQNNSGGPKMLDLLSLWPGTLTNGPTWATGPLPELPALNFDGTDDFVDFGNPSSSMFAGDFTIAFWWFAGGGSIGTQVLFSKGTTNSIGLTIFTRAGSDRVEIRLGLSTQASADSSVAAGVWNYLVATRYAGVITVLNNGVQLLSAAETTNPATSDPIRLGADNRGNVITWLGKLTDLRVCGTRGASSGEAFGWYDEARKGYPTLLRRYTPATRVFGGTATSPPPSGRLARPCSLDGLGGAGQQAFNPSLGV